MNILEIHVINDLIDDGGVPGTFVKKRCHKDDKTMKKKFKYKIEPPLPIFGKIIGERYSTSEVWLVFELETPDSADTQTIQKTVENTIKRLVEEISKPNCKIIKLK